MLLRHFSFIFLILGISASNAWAEDLKFKSKSITWPEFDQTMKDQTEKDQVTGVSYIISGAVATLGGLVGYNNSQDAFSKAVYGISQSIGIAAIGYGGYFLSVGNEHRSFHSVLEDPSLTTAQRESLLKKYVDLKEEESRRSKKIKWITHSLVAALNIYNGLTAQNDTLRTAFYFIGGVNVLAAISFAF